VRLESTEWLIDDITEALECMSQDELVQVYRQITGANAGLVVDESGEAAGEVYLISE
jgi:hypothetical protein